MAALIHSIRVATWNVHEGLPTKQGMSVQHALDEASSLLVDLRIDIIALQEVDFDVDSRSSILEAITGNTQLRYTARSILSESSFFPEGRAGVALASRYPLSGVRKIEFENPRLTTRIDGHEIRSHDKGLVSATVPIFGREITAVSLHALPFHIFGREASDQTFSPLWSSLVDELANLTQHPMVVCGDFNTRRRDLVLVPVKLDLLRVIEDVPTYKDQSLDDILYSGEFRAGPSQVIDNFSDHKLCVAELSWKE